jgi:hypothetical protein
VFVDVVQWRKGSRWEDQGALPAPLLTLPASSMVEVIWHQHAYEPQRLNEHYY